MLKYTDSTVYLIYWLQIDLLSSWKFYSQWQAGKLHYYAETFAGVKWKGTKKDTFDLFFL